MRRGGVGIEGERDRVKGRGEGGRVRGERLRCGFTSQITAL
jgi:hypothetical protein